VEKCLDFGNSRSGFARIHYPRPKARTHE
jgi:hypothetical protein